VVVALPVLGGRAAWLWISTQQDRDEPAAEQPPIPRPASVATRVERPAPPTVAPAPATMAAAPVSVAAAPPSQAPPSQAAPRPPRPAEPRAAEPQPWESALNRALQNARDGDDAGAVLNLQRALQQAPEPQEALRRAREAVPLQDAARRSPRVASMLGITVKPAPEDAPSTP
jgi:Meckel syndrome type 1 protein